MTVKSIQVLCPMRGGLRLHCGDIISFSQMRKDCLVGGLGREGEPHNQEVSSSPSLMERISCPRGEAQAPGRRFRLLPSESHLTHVPKGNESQKNSVQSGRWA